MTAPLLPPALWEQLSAFLAAGHTGKVEISVRCGRVTGYVIAGSWQVTEPERDAPRIVELTEPRRRVQSGQR